MEHIDYSEYSPQIIHSYNFWCYPNKKSEFLIPLDLKNNDYDFLLSVLHVFPIDFSKFSNKYDCKANRYENYTVKQYNFWNADFYDKFSIGFNLFIILFIILLFFYGIFKFFQIFYHGLKSLK